MKKICMTEDLLDYIFTELRKEAESENIRAGFNGDFPPAWVSRLEDDIDCYMSGFKKQVPSCWQNIAIQYMKEKDPDYKKYLELKQKFDNYECKEN